MEIFFKILYFTFVKLFLKFHTKSNSYKHKAKIGKVENLYGKKIHQFSRMIHIIADQNIPSIPDFQKGISSQIVFLRN